MNWDVDPSLSIEELEGVKWGNAPIGSTALVSAVHSLRKRPIGELNAYEMSRMIGQNVGLPWLMPAALRILRATADEEAAGGFYDDDLLSAVLTRPVEVWRMSPYLIEQMCGILDRLTDLSQYIEADVAEFREKVRSI
jgi:hypothetical protein